MGERRLAVTPELAEAYWRQVADFRRRFQLRQYSEDKWCLMTTDRRHIATELVVDRCGLKLWGDYKDAQCSSIEYWRTLTGVERMEALQMEAEELALRAQHHEDICAAADLLKELSAQT